MNLFIAFVPLISCARIRSDWRTRICPSRRGSSVKLSLCNEVIRELSFERQCALAAGLGYRGLEVAPFTFGDDAWRMPASRRAEIRRACADAGIEVSGLHWLLAAPAGLSITTRRPRGLAEERRRHARLGRALRRSRRRLSRAWLAGAAPRRPSRTTAERARGGLGASPPRRRRRPASSIASSRWRRPTAISSTRWPRPPTS